MSRSVFWVLMVLLLPMAVAACGQQEAVEQAVEVVQEEAEQVAAEAEEAAEQAEEASEAVAEAVVEEMTEPEVIIGDVIDYSLDPHEDWAETGQFGWVKFELHEGWADGEPAYYIRTDTSDETFAKENGLVWAPIIGNALSAEGASTDLFVFDGGADGQLPVMANTPADAEGFSPAFHIRTVTFTGEPMLLDSAEAVQAALDAGSVEVEETLIVVNYPVVKWAGGELPVDTALDSYLGTGQLIELDTEGMTVTFKLHECYSGARYIVTDTSAVPMAPMMSIAPSGGTAALAEAGATDQIHVFGNGVEGSGVMGGQPAIFRSKAGSPAWSPFWDHFTLVWNDDAEPRVLTSQAEIEEAIKNGEATRFNGTPDTDPMGFVVNCPVPVLAPNTFDAE